MTKSYYALVGEIIRPYESPSKQLSAINKCLNRYVDAGTDQKEYLDLINSIDLSYLHHSRLFGKQL